VLASLKSQVDKLTIFRELARQTTRYEMNGDQGEVPETLDLTDADVIP
jgi:hypothetical protein